MKILYIYRNNSLGFSIGNVFRPIEEEMRKYAEVDSIYMPCSTASPLSIIKNCWYAFKKALSGHYDIIHVTGDVHYLAYALSVFRNVVVTVHDVGQVVSARATNKYKLLYFLYVKSLGFAKQVTFISNKTKDEVLDLYNISADKCSVVMNPVSPRFNYKPKTINRERPVILHLGNRESKNLKNSAFALAAINCELRVIGKLSEYQKEYLDACGVYYSNDYNLTNDEVLEEYKKCDIVNLPSFYEGFGMPIIEGQTVGRAVVTSNLQPMVDIANGSCVIVVPDDIESMRKGYKDAIDNYEYYVKRGIENSKRFSIDNIVRQYKVVYKKIKS